MDTTRAGDLAWEVMRKLARAVRAMKSKLPTNEAKAYARQRVRLLAECNVWIPEFNPPGGPLSN